MLWDLPPPWPMGRWKFQARGNEVRASKLSFFPSLSVSFPEKKFIFQCLSVESFTFFDIDQKPKRELTSLPPTPPCPSDTGRCLFLSLTNADTHSPQWWGSSRWHPHQGPCGRDSAMTCGPHLRGHCGSHCSYDTSL